METAKKLYRSRENKVVSGVAGGIAEYFQVDSVLVRLGFVLVALVTQIIPMVIVYIVMAIVIPLEPKGEHTQTAESEHHSENHQRNKTGRVLIGTVLVVGGLFILLRQFVPVFWFGWNIFIAAVLIIFGFYFVFRKTV